jgi:hypothetical protein
MDPRPTLGLFDFNNISLSPVHMHKHLGVIFSNDCKWTKHTDVLIERTSKELNILRKLKYRLKRDYLEKISCFNSTWKVRILENRQTVKRYMYIVTTT